MNAESSPSWHVCLVTDVYPPDCGGSGWSTHALARVLVGRGHQVSVVALDPDRTDVVTRTYDGVAVTDVGVHAARHSVRERIGARDYTYRTLARFLDRFLRTNRSIDVVHAQHLHSGPPSVAVGNALGRATVVTVRDYWPVCLHGTSWWGETVCQGCTTQNLAGCMSEYWGWPRPVSRVMGGWARKRLDARASGLAAADKVLSVSQAVKNRVHDQLPGADLTVIPNMVDPQYVERIALAHRDASRQEPYMLAAGKLQPTKGFDLLLSALSEVGASRHVSILVAGEGPSRAALERQARVSELPVTFLGWVDHDRLLGLQHGAEAVLLPSAWNEPLSRVALETMALGTPVVAWNRGGNPEIIESGVNGWLVSEPGDLDEALKSLDSPGRRRMVGDAARARVGEHFSPDAVCSQVEAVYASALEKSGRVVDTR